MATRPPAGLVEASHSGRSESRVSFPDGALWLASLRPVGRPWNENSPLSKRHSGQLLHFPVQIQRGREISGYGVPLLPHIPSSRCPNPSFI